MQDQHKKIKGYRDLSAREIELMNRCKGLEDEVLDLIDSIEAHHAACVPMPTEFSQAGPDRWRSIGKTDIEKGFMALIRSVALPTDRRG